MECQSNISFFIGTSMLWRIHQRDHEIEEKVRNEMHTQLIERGYDMLGHCFMKRESKIRWKAERRKNRANGSWMWPPMVEDPWIDIVHVSGIGSLMHASTDEILLELLTHVTDLSLKYNTTELLEAHLHKPGYGWARDIRSISAFWDPS